MLYIKFLSFLNPSGCFPCRKWNKAKSVKQEDQIFDHHWNAHSVKDICMIKWLKLQDTIAKEVFWTINTSLETSWGKRCSFSITLYISSWTNFFSNCPNTQKCVLMWMSSPYNTEYWKTMVCKKMIKYDSQHLFLETQFKRNKF